MKKEAMERIRYISGYVGKWYYNWLFRVYKGDCTAPLWWDYDKTIIRIPVNQARFNGKYVVFFS